MLSKSSWFISLAKIDKVVASNRNPLPTEAFTAAELPLKPAKNEASPVCPAPSQAKSVKVGWAVPEAPLAAALPAEVKSKLPVKGLKVIEIIYLLMF